MQKKSEESKCPVTETEHITIAKFLQDELPDFMESLPLDKLTEHNSQSICQLLKILPSVYRQTQPEISDKLCKLPGNDYKIHRSTISRWIKGTFNDVLGNFSREYNINPPIHLFSSYYDADADKNSPAGAFLTCGFPLKRKNTSNTVDTDTIVSFAKAYGGDISEFKDNLREQAEEALKDKLAGKDNDYIPLALEIGKIPEKQPNQFDDENLLPKDHNRIWHNFNIDNLKNLDGKYILSSETGSGKTTFLRHLQLELLNKTDAIPLFLTANDMLKLDFANNNNSNFIDSLAHFFNEYISGGGETEF